MLRTSDFDYDLPENLIAQFPIEPRDSSRLFVLERQSGNIVHGIFRDVDNFLVPGDLLVLNETKVIPARLYGTKIPTGGKVELLLLRQIDDVTWEALVGGSRLTKGKVILIEDRLRAEINSVLEGPRRLVVFEQPISPLLDTLGHVPLPPYIHTTLADPDRYQTIYASKVGSAAAPTAGLHFTEELINKLIGQGIKFVTVTLHIGLDTFAPVSEEDPLDHKIHTEWCKLTKEVAMEINETHTNGGRIIAVGTTSVRTLESAASKAGNNQIVAPYEGPTSLFILPGYKFKAVDALITNFHLPRSTLIMLVSAFAGRERIMSAYRLAILNQYRFYSFGDAMLLL
jgi:S-adenosylmethionine:tRNA ribosyltransferase-isomerase